MMRRLQMLAAGLVVATLAGCVQPNGQSGQTGQSPALSSEQVRWGNVTYPNREKALEAVRRDADRDLAQIEPSNQRLGGSLLFAYPNRQALRDLFFETTTPKNANMAELSADVTLINLDTWVKALQKAKIVDKAELKLSTDSEHEAFEGFDYKLWAVRTSNGQWKWYLTSSNGGTREMVLGPNMPSAATRMVNFNIAIVNTAIALGAPGTRQPFQSAAGGQAGPVSGTSFQINAAGFALTNAHVVESCKSIKMLVGEGVEADATLVVADRENDLAVIKVPPRGLHHALFRAGPPVRQGEEVVAYGYPLAGALSTAGNLSTGVVSALAGMREDTRKFQISAPVQQGNSGGPLFDMSGDVIGVVQSKLNALAVATMTGDVPQNVNFAIKSSIVANFLETNGIAFETAHFKAPLSVADISEKAKAFTFMVRCQR